MKRINSLVLASQGSQGVCILREIFSLGFKPDQIKVITFNSKFNSPFIEFLEFNKMDYALINSKEELEKYFSNKNVDILLSFSFKYIFSSDCLSKIKIASINFHPGILPNYKGSFSTPWSIINNEKDVGYTYHHIVDKVDSGDIIFKESFPISEEATAHDLNYLVFQNGISNLKNMFLNVLNGNKEKQKGEGYFYPNKLPNKGIIDLSWDEPKIGRFIRAMYFPPFKPAKLIYKGKEYLISTFNEFKEIVK